MKKEELSDWFLNKIECCYPVKHRDFSDRVYLFYDEQLVRKMKLCKLNNIKFKTDRIVGNCLFTLDYTNNKLYCDHHEIWSFLESNYNKDYVNIKYLIIDILKNINKLSSNKKFFEGFVDKKTNILLIPTNRSYLFPYNQNKIKLSTNQEILLIIND